MTGSQKTMAIHDMFRAFADPTRLRLLNLVAGREVCVCYFVEILRLSQPKISRHLAYLRRAGVVAARREGKWMHYRLAIPRDRVAAVILRETLKHLRDAPEMRQDVARLNLACCSPEKYEVPPGAPLPGRMPGLLRSDANRLRSGRCCL
ncbi:MAG: metalloregulator ArsR/SmtB family transcription factor [Candidatus Acidiferrales bacterium]